MQPGEVWRGEGEGVVGAEQRQDTGAVPVEKGSITDRAADAICRRKQDNLKGVGDTILQMIPLEIF